MVIFDVASFRSVMVLNGNGADVAKHCVPAVPSKRYPSMFCLSHLSICVV